MAEQKKEGSILVAIIVIIVVILITSAGVYYVYNNYKTTPESPMVGNDRDAYGCIGSAGYSWCEAKQKCLRPWEEKCCLAEGELSYENVYSTTPANQRLKCCPGLIPQENNNIADAPAICIKNLQN